MDMLMIWLADFLVSLDFARFLHACCRFCNYLPVIIVVLRAWNVYEIMHLGVCGVVWGFS